MNNEDQSKLNPFIFYAARANADSIITPGKSYGKRVAKSFELELITGGEGTIITDGKHFKAVKGNLFFRYPGTVVEGISGYYCYLVLFDSIYNKEKQHLYTSAPFQTDNEPNAIIDNGGIVFYIPDKMTVKDYTQVETLFFNIFNNYMNSGQNNQLKMKADLLKIIDLAEQEYRLNCFLVQNKRTIKNNYSKIMQCKEFIDNNLDKKLSLEVLSNKVDLSKNFFCKVFKDIIGKTPFEYINEERINLAKRLLSTTNKSIIEISFMCGFDDITYFYRVFKRYTNMTPLYFRQLHTYY